MGGVESSSVLCKIAGKSTLALERVHIFCGPCADERSPGLAFLSPPWPRADEIPGPGDWGSPGLAFLSPPWPRADEIPGPGDWGEWWVTWLVYRDRRDAKAREEFLARGAAARSGRKPGLPPHVKTFPGTGTGFGWARPSLRGGKVPRYQPVGGKMSRYQPVTSGGVRLKEVRLRCHRCHLETAIPWGELKEKARDAQSRAEYPRPPESRIRLFAYAGGTVSRRTGADRGL